MDLKQLHQLKCELLKVYRYQGLTLQELLCEFYSHINEVINSTNGLIDIVDYLVGDGLSQEVAAHLNQMLIDGTFDKIISNKVDELSTNLNNQFNEMKKIIESNISESNNLIENLKIYDSRFNNIENKNIEQDNRLKEVENKNKVQDVYLSGLFNENKDGRLSIEGVGNDIKLEGSKAGLVEVEKVVGNTLVNILSSNDELDGTNDYLKNNNWEILNLSSEIDSNISNHIFTLNGGHKQILFRRKLDSSPLLKTSTTLTLIVEVLSTDYVGGCTIGNNDKFKTASLGDIFASVGTKKILIKTKDDFTDAQFDFYIYFQQILTGTLKFKMYILEGDYTNKPIPSESFEGLKSSFEENLVTQEMINEGLESEENLGKYKVPIRLFGKNIFDGELENGGINKDGVLVDTNCTRSKNFIKVKPNTNYIFTPPTDYTGIIYIHEYNNEFKLSELEKGSTSSKRSFVTGANTVYLKFNSYNPGLGDRPSLIGTQLEEGIVATGYEDYFERTTNVYLNSPLLEGDEIVMHDGELCHYHKCGNIVLDNTIDWTGRAKVGTSYAMQTTATFNKTFDTTSNINGFCDKLPIDIYPYETSSSCIDLRTIPNKIILKLSNLLTGLDDVVDSNKEVNSAFKIWLQSNPVTVTYKLAEPYYEPIQADKLLLECANDSTLHIDTVVPVESISTSYTGNVPSVYAIEETGITNTADIAVTQMAVDFLLMSSMGESLMISFLNNVKGINNLGTYFASRIIKKALSYDDVINKYPQFKDDIDTVLVTEGYEYLIK